MTGDRQPAVRRLVVDWTRCDGHGLCRALLPERIALDEWGFPIVTASEVRPAGERDARRAVATCPALALSLTAPTRPSPTTGAR